MSQLGSKRSFKVCLLGDPRVGKTSIRRTYMGKGFQQNYNVTLGADFAVKRTKDSKVLQIWDLGGQQVYKQIRTGYYKGAEGAILIFDIVRIPTFETISKWVDELTVNAGKKIPMILVGNKSDLREEGVRSVGQKDGQNYAATLTKWSGFNVPYIESSALTGQNIDNIFDNLIEEISILHSTQMGK